MGYTTRSKRRIQRGEHGSVVVVSVAWTTLAIFALGAMGYFEGRAALERTQTQIRADAMAMGSALVARAYGPVNRCAEGYGSGYMTRIFQLNGGDGAMLCPAVSDRDFMELTRAYAFDGNENGVIEGRFGQWNIEAEISMAGRAMRIFELVASRDDFEKELANVDLVLDYSRSMDELLGGRTRRQRLIEAIGVFFEIIENVRVGAVLFATPIIDQVPIGDLTPEHIADIINLVNTPVPRGDNGATNYAAALQETRRRLQAEPIGGQYVIFVSDGQPTVPDPITARANAQNQAAFVHAAGIKVFGLFIGDPGQADIMESVASQPELGEPPGMYLEIDSQNEDAIRNFFSGFTSTYVCRLKIPVEDTLINEYPLDKTSVWMRFNGETPGLPLEYVPNTEALFEELDAAGDPVDMSTYFRYTISEPADRDYLTIYITQAAYERLDEDGYDLAFRSGFTMLAGRTTEL